jgi:ketosteroid isomerase-like protein
MLTLLYKPLGLRWSRMRGFCALLGVLFVTLCVSACSKSDPEREVRAALTQMQSAIESRDTGAFMGFVADDFTRADEAMTARDVRRILTGIFLTQQKINIGASIQSVVIEGKPQDRALVKVNVIATGSGANAVLPTSAQTWEITAALRREGSTWRVFNAQLKPIS